MKRSKVREIVLKALYACEIGNNDPETIFEYILQEEKKLNDSKESKLAFGKALLNGVINNIEKLDNMLGSYTIEWKLARIDAVDRNILRMGLYEMLFDNDIPNAVVLNEVIELAKKYGTNDSSRFINGILGKINNDLDRKNEGG